MGNVAIVVQARMGSTRLPGKVIEPIGRESTISLLIKRLKKSRYRENIVLATTKEKEDDILIEHCKSLGVKIRRGKIMTFLNGIFRQQATKMK